MVMIGNGNYLYCFILQNESGQSYVSTLVCVCVCVCVCLCGIFFVACLRTPKVWEPLNQVTPPAL